MPNSVISWDSALPRVLKMDFRCSLGGAGALENGFAHVSFSYRRLVLRISFFWGGKNELFEDLRRLIRAL